MKSRIKKVLIGCICLASVSAFYDTARAGTERGTSSFISAAVGDRH